MDQPCSYEDFRGCLVDMAKLNRATGTYRPTFSWLKRVIATRPNLRKPLHIVDVGCGYGDMLRLIDEWASTQGIAMKLTGIDLNPYSARAAEEASAEHRSIKWITGNALSLKLPGEIDVVISSLFTHHLADDEIVQFICWMEASAQHGWFINDLHRHWLAYYGFKVWAKAARWHPFIQHDGPLSIRRSFVRADWERLCMCAGIEQRSISIEWYRSFRLCVGRLRD